MRLPARSFEISLEAVPSDQSLCLFFFFRFVTFFFFVIRKELFWCRYDDDDDDDCWVALEAVRDDVDHHRSVGWCREWFESRQK